jgi:hypothetical protein
VPPRAAGLAGIEYGWQGLTRRAIGKLMTEQLDAPRHEERPDALPPEEASALAAQPLPARIDAPEPGDPWVAEAVKAVEASITKLMDEFRFYPFAHRVEHSLHARFFELLREWDLLRGWHPLNDGVFKGQVIHKEWPETIPEPGKRRGSFDLVVLAPSQLAQASVAQFQLGQIAAPIVIELGLGYWLQHLTADIDKLTHSKVEHPYIVHLSRMPSGRRRATEEHINDKMNNEAKVVYVHHDVPGKTVSYKGLDDNRICGPQQWVQM